MEVARSQAIIPWETEVIRFTGFPVPLYDISQASWWSDLFEQPPDVEQVQTKTGIKRSEGILANKKIILDISQQRIDWILAGDNQNSPNPFMNSIGDFNSAINELAEMLHKWFQLPSVPKLQRIAFGSILFFPVENKNKGYERVQSFLPDVKLDPIGTSDFLYQINRPRKSSVGIEGLSINRLTKWSVATTFLYPIMPGVLRIDQTLQSFACRLELDINTAPDYPNEIDHDQANQIWPELFELAKEISERGDVP